MRNFLYDMEALVAATDNFSSANQLGGGGFGFVYKVAGIFFSSVLSKTLKIILYDGNNSRYSRV